jgi:hypothetical protein
VRDNKSLPQPPPPTQTTALTSRARPTTVASIKRKPAYRQVIPGPHIHYHVNITPRDDPPPLHGARACSATLQPQAKEVTANRPAKFDTNPPPRPRPLPSHETVDGMHSHETSQDNPTQPPLTTVPSPTPIARKPANPPPQPSKIATAAPADACHFAINAPARSRHHRPPLHEPDSRIPPQPCSPTREEEPAERKTPPPTRPPATPTTARTPSPDVGPTGPEPQRAQRVPQCKGITPQTYRSPVADRSTHQHSKMGRVEGQRPHPRHAPGRPSPPPRAQPRGHLMHRNPPQPTAPSRTALDVASTGRSPAATESEPTLR